MRKFLGIALAVLSVLFLLSGYGWAGQKTTSMVVIYAITTGLSGLLVAGYFLLVQERNPWFVFLLCSVLLVNIGYYLIAISDTLEQALAANRIAYLGSVFLPVCMFMIIANVTALRLPRGLPVCLLILAGVIFAIAASPGILDVYYKEVRLMTVAGVSVLDKVYGPLHPVYLFYLVSFFAAMTAVILCAYFKKLLPSPTYAAVLLAAVFVNIAVWMLEQLVKIDFEFLSVSYLMSEVFLLGLYLLQQEQQTASPASTEEPLQTDAELQEQAEQLMEKRRQAEGFAAELTPTERKIFDLYIAGSSTKDIMAQLCIKENTLKFHNKNIYGKFGVSSRKQLVALWQDAFGE